MTMRRANKTPSPTPTHRQPFFGNQTSSRFFAPKVLGLQPSSAPEQIIQRSPNDIEDFIHQPIIDRYRREMGLAPGEGPSDAEIKYRLAPAYFSPEHALNHERHDNTRYINAVVNWPNDSSIWAVLQSRQAREEFVRYIVNFDLTNCRPYAQGTQQTAGACQNFQRNAETFANLCQGYASQMYAQYTSTNRLPQADRDRLAQFGRIYVEQLPAKFHIPIFMATVPGHAFNAILVDANPRSLSDYLFLEPQNDNLFNANSATFRSYVSEGILTIGRLAEFNERGQYIESIEQTFVQEASGTFINQPLTNEQRIALSRLFSAFAIADDSNAWRVTIQQANITFEDHLRREGQINSADNLIFAARFMIGRRFRRSPQATYETLTESVYLDLLGRQDLAQRLRTALAPPTP